MKKKNRFSAPDEYVMTKYIYSRLPHTVNTHAFIKNSCFIEKKNFNFSFRLFDDAVNRTSYDSLIGFSSCSAGFL